MLQRFSLARPGLGVVLAIAFGTLMLFAVGSVLIVSIGGAGRNTTELLADKVELILSSIEQRIRQQFEPVVIQAEYLRLAIERQQLDLGNTKELETALRSALGATPQVVGIGFIRPDLTVTLVQRMDGNAKTENWSHRPEIAQVVQNAQRDVGIGWNLPVWSEGLRQAIIPFVLPVRRKGEVVGFLVPTITVAELSRYVAEMSTTAQQAFILHGRDEVLAHPSLATLPPKGSREHPLPRLTDVGDRALAAIWSQSSRSVNLLERFSGRSHFVAFGDEYFVYVYRQIAGPGGKPWLVGAILPGSEVGQEAERLRLMAAIGAALLLVSVLAAVLGGSYVARPMRNVVAVTEAVRKLNFTNAPVLTRSRIREIDAVAQALNAMVTALRWFELYLPKRLVQQLLEQGEVDLARTYERDVTVMFTDICEFTGTASRLSPSETASFLNAHFALVGQCVEAEEGTIDKYMGDSVMAFWGAPDLQPDHVERACRAALAIAKAVKGDNEERREKGLAPLCMRIGISTGTVLVGNIGAPNRMNYTIVGDTVNVAQRLEQLGKDSPCPSEVTVLVTEECHRCLQDGSGFEFLGRRQVRNRNNEVGVYRLF